MFPGRIESDWAQSRRLEDGSRVDGVFAIKLPIPHPPFVVKGHVFRHLNLFFGL